MSGPGYKPYTPMSWDLSPVNNEKRTPIETVEALDHKTIEQMVNESVARQQSEWAAAQIPAPLTPDDEIRQRLDKAKFQEAIADAAVAAGVRPSSIRFIVRDAADVFELRDGSVVPRHGETDPADPVIPLTPLRWLEQLRAADPYLFSR